jgi:hypothetical protein
MTDAQLKKLAKENNIEPTYELLAFARLVLINAKIQDLKSVAINTRLAVEKEREACAKLCEEYQWADRAAEAIRARGDVHAIDISEKRVDETAKDRHEWVGFTSAERDEIVPMLVQSLINHDDKTMTALLRAILIDVEAKLKEKNT